MTTIDTILAAAAELKDEQRKTQYVPHYYKRGGKMIKRIAPDIVYTARYEFLAYDDASPLAIPAFRCCECGEMVNYHELEAWTCDFEHGNYICALCYEDAMGEDL